LEDVVENKTTKNVKDPLEKVWNIKADYDKKDLCCLVWEPRSDDESEDLMVLIVNHCKEKGKRENS
jgi:hypothetical protein